MSFTVAGEVDFRCKKLIKIRILKVDFLLGWSLIVGLIWLLILIVLIKEIDLDSSLGATADLSNKFCC